MASTPKPVRKQIKKVALSHKKKHSSSEEHRMQFGEPTKQAMKKNIKGHTERLKSHVKKTGKIAR